MKHMKKIEIGKFMRTCLKKMMNYRIKHNSDHDQACECCCCWWWNGHDVWPSSSSPASIHGEIMMIPRDVPKGHLVVYVGEDHKRHVIKVRILNHPLFQALLDLAREEYEFSKSSKLYIPCDEGMFLDVVRIANSSRHRRGLFS
ncbi:uncharacterized protein LOC124935616 [Impatiens glandulifera]|uniref:uncharacterized protein LOC124935616 n=1 Tax=Impatiens glandulifera TaxID=253017 RepID=UPI001FB1039F|nr:uncharacterized protein LOC124935616 [Impatiens glandulifera]